MKISEEKIERLAREISKNSELDYEFVKEKLNKCVNEADEENELVKAFIRENVSIEWLICLLMLSNLEKDNGEQRDEQNN